MASKFEERLGKMIEAARASERPYNVLEGKPFNLSASVARTIVVGSGLSKSSDEVRDREAARIKRWLEAGAIGGKPKAAPKPKAEPKASEGTHPEQNAVIAIPDEASAGVDAAYEESRNRPARKPRKDGQASDTAKAIAASREPDPGPSD